MLLVSCIPLTGTLMLIHYYLVSTVDTGKLKLSQLKRKSKKHYNFFSPNNRYYATPSEALPWNSLCCLHTCFLCSEKENSISSGVLPYPQTTHPEHSYKHSFFCFKGGEKEIWYASAWLSEYLSSSPAYNYWRNDPLCLYTLCQGTTDNIMGITYVV